MEVTNKNFGISFKVIPHSEQRYNTVADYTTDDKGQTLVLVSDMGDWRYEYLLAYHEMTEVALCRLAGIQDSVIDAFDFEFTKNRDPDDFSEPGDDPNAPYHEQHKIASAQEKFMAKQLGVDWDEYEAKIAELYKERALSGIDD